MTTMTTQETEFYFAGLNTWRVELFIQSWDGAPVATEWTANALQIAKRELSARQN